MRVCKHSCDVKMFWRRFFSWKLDKFTLLTHSLIGWNLENLYEHAVSIFWCLSWHFKREKSIFWKASFLQNKNCLPVQDFVYKTSRLVLKNFSFNFIVISAMITNSFAFFKGLGEFPTVMQTFRILPTPLGFISGYANTKMFSIA